MENWSVKANERQRWQRLHWSLLAGSLVAALATGFAVSLDQNSSEWLRGFKVPGDLRKAISLSEVFAHGFGVAAILGTLLFLSEQNRRSAIWGAILITFVAGGTANILKGGFVRIRPHSVGQIEVVDASALAATGHGERTGEAEVVKASFWDARQRSFPSGHAATACSATQFSVWACGYRLWLGDWAQPRISERRWIVCFFCDAGLYSKNQQRCALLDRCPRRRCGRASL